MKRLLKNNHGMTLMEILVALTLLMIVIVGTTPVMLSAFDGLYTAGEYTQDTYQAKSEVEEKLATRNTKDVYNPGFQVNFNNIGEVANINARRAVSSLYGSVETLFSNGKVHVSIVSAKTVNDDLPTIASTDPDDYYEVIIQTTNLDFGDDVTNKYEAAAKVSLNDESEVEDGNKDCEKIIDLTFIIPDKTQDGEGKIYSYKDEKNHANIYMDGEGNECEADPITGRIKVRINGFDFTQSPIKIRVSYLDENYKKKTTETYLFVEQPTIIAAGETGTYHYYTSPGVLQTKQIVKENGKEVTKTTENFGLYGRTMRIDETNPDGTATTYTDPLHSSTVKIKEGTSAIKDGTVFKSVNWITEDETTGAVNPYYVLTGTNGAIYRTYVFNGTNEELSSLLKVQDETYNLKDKTATVVYPALWGGDKAHQFGYSTYGKSMVYDFTDESGNERDNGCWYTESGRDTGVGHPRANVYGTSAEYAYYYNGWGQTYVYMSQKSRKISYILTEHGLSLRLGGYLAGEADHHKNYNLMWENLNNINYPTSYTTNTGFTDKSRWDRRDFYHPTFGSSVITAVWGSDNKDQTQSQDCPLYLNDKGDTDGDMFADIYWGNIRIKYLSNMPLEYFHASGRRGHWNGKPQDGQSSSVRFLNHQQWSNDGKTYDVYDPKITVTDAVYLPALGSMFYVGTVAADAYLQQNDNLANEDGWVDVYEFQPADSHGAITTYLVRGNEDGTATEVHKYSYPQIDYNGYDFEWSHYNALVTDYYLAGKATMTEVKTSDANNVAEEFFVTRPATPASRLFTDVSFTLGFSSNREYVYSEIVYGMVDGSLKETYKSYEHYYFKSHYKGDTKHIPQAAIVNNEGNSTLYSQTADNLNKVYNDYYNVWFPGEMYNITKLATKDGITVGTGYTVSGSTYQFVLGTNDTNTSTALGGIFNDGVLACSIDANDTSLENLLYFKDNASFDGSYLSNKSGYKTAFPSGYGTHTRDSIQFTAVDIGVQRVVTDTTEKATYYAYYADNKGRVFRSKVAVKSSSVPNDYDPDAENANQNVEVKSLKKVEYISDVIVQSGDTKLTDDTIGYMEQLQPTGINFTTLFDKITTLKIDGKMIFISGKPKQGSSSLNGVPVVVGMVNDETNTIKWTVVYMQVSGGSYTSYWIEDMIVLGDYFYTVGQKGTKGFMTAIPTSMLRVNLDKETPSSSCIFTQTVDTTFGNELYIEEVDQRLYAVAGK